MSDQRHAGEVTVYVAARPEHQARAAAIRASLAHFGIGCTARWLEEHRVEASERIHDIQRADVLLLLNPKAAHGTGAGGCHTELGIALGLGKPVILFGDRENGYHAPDVHVTHVPDGATPDRLVVAINLAAKFGTPLPVSFGVKEGVAA